jgi:hypothetical protein
MVNTTYRKARDGLIHVRKSVLFGEYIIYMADESDSRLTRTSTSMTLYPQTLAIRHNLLQKQLTDYVKPNTQEHVNYSGK